MELIDLLHKYEENDKNKIIKYIRELINYTIVEKNNNSQFPEEIKVKNTILIYEFCISLEKITKKRINTQDLLKLLPGKIMVQDLSENITKARKQLYQYLMEIIELNLIQSEELSLDQVIHQVRDIIYVNSYINEEPDIKTFNEYTRKTKSMLKTTDYILFKGLYNYEFNPEKSIYKIYVHNQFNNAVEKFVIREILKEVKDESLEKAEDDSESEITNRIFTSLGKDKMIANFFTKSHKIINKLENYNYDGKSVDMLHFVEDNLEFYNIAKSILKSEIERQNYEYEDTMMKAERESNKIKNQNELKNLTNTDIENILLKLKLILTENGKQAFKGILQKEERKERFKEIIFKAFPVNAKNICQLRFEVEKCFKEKETLDQIRNEINQQMDLLIKK